MLHPCDSRYVAVRPYPGSMTGFRAEDSSEAEQSAEEGVGGPKVLLFAHHKCDTLHALTSDYVSPLQDISIHRHAKE